MQALAGEEVIIAKVGKPIAKLVSIQPRLKRRVPGLASGKVWMSPDFDGPINAEWLDLFYNGPIFPELVKEDLVRPKIKSKMAS